MRFGFLIFPQVEELDFVGPWEMVGMWGEHFGGPNERLIVSQHGGSVRCAKNLQVVADHSFATCPRLDYLLVPGGQGTRQEVNNPELIQFVQQQAASCRQLLSVCTGAFILQAAGLLEDKKATTHWRSLDRLRQFENVTVVEQRIVRDGNVWSAAGVSAGIDLTLALIADQAGQEVAGQVQLAVEYYPAGTRYGNAHLAPKAPAYLRTS